MARRFFKRKPTDAPQTLKHYRIVRTIGHGGMGVVFAAEDTRLGRSVAIKRIHGTPTDPRSRERLWREARAVASVNHPNICQVYEIGEIENEPYIVMELLDGEALTARLERGAIEPAESVRVALEILGALAAIHARGMIHRDLKPSNIFLTPHGAKLLDFGLARLVRGSHEDGATLTKTGAVAGTPRYMSPEQLLGTELDSRSDIFAIGALLFEMVGGRPAFDGKTPQHVFQLILTAPPPVLDGSCAVASISRVIRRAMAKKPEDRHPSADAMAAELRAVEFSPRDDACGLQVKAMSRLIVLPFRMLRPDPEVDYLSFSLADAITSSLGGLDSLLVRSSLTAARYAGEVPSLDRLATEAEVDSVLTGTLLRAGDVVRVNAQLSEVPAGTLLWSHNVRVPLREIADLERELAAKVIEALAVPVSDGEKRMIDRDVPASPSGYEFFLRANQQAVGYDVDGWRVAVGLYLQATERDPLFAPAWARLARMHWLMGKYVESHADNLSRAEQALGRALELNPDLAIAHGIANQIAVSSGRAPDALRSLLVRARSGKREPDLFAGLVLALRFGGLTEASLQAHERARQLDPKIPTSVTNTYWQIGRVEECLREAGGDLGNVLMCLWTLGRKEEALAWMRSAKSPGGHTHLQAWADAYRGVYEGRPELARPALERLVEGFPDPEGKFYAAGLYARIGDVERSIDALDRAIAGRFCSPRAMRSDPFLERARDHPAFHDLLRRAERGHAEARRIYVDEGSEALLGPAESAA
jgi:serine/threonine protein kinase/tetratricopeptide (TPR) repeat protein